MEARQESLFDHGRRSVEPELLRIFKQALKAISDAWVPGALDHARARTKARAADLERAEGNLERVWQLVAAGYLTVSDFREAVAVWRDLHFQVIEVFKNVRAA